jgi:hypothetical protein
MAKYKMTPLARFFIFMLIAAPLLFLLATYMTGERKYLNQVIEWVQPTEAEQVATPILDTAETAVQDSHQNLSPPADTVQATDSVRTESDALSSAKEDLTLRDSLNLLKKQLADCKNN